MSISDQQRRDDEFAADMLVIEELVRGLSLNHWPGDAETILEVGDLEVTRILAVRHDARRYMIIDLCKSFRFELLHQQRPRPTIGMPDVPFPVPGLPEDS